MRLLGGQPLALGMGGALPRLHAGEAVLELRGAAFALQAPVALGLELAALLVDRQALRRHALLEPVALAARLAELLLQRLALGGHGRQPLAERRKLLPCFRGLAGIAR